MFKMLIVIFLNQVCVFEVWQVGKFENNELIFKKTKRRSH